MSRRIPVARLLRHAFGALVVLILLSGTAGVTVSWLQHRSIRQLSEHVLPLRLANERLRVALSDAQVSLRGYLLTGDAVLLDEYDRAAADFPPLTREIRALAKSRWEREAVETQVNRAAAWWSEAERQRDTRPRSEEATRWVRRSGELATPIRAVNADIASHLQGEERQVRRNSALLRAAALAALAVLTAVAVLLAATTSVRTTRRITRPLGRLLAGLGRLASGDLTARVAGNIDLAEIHSVAGALNTLIAEVERAGERRAESDRLAAAARRLGIRVRYHLSVDAVLVEATAGLGRALGADHVVVRLVSEDDYRGFHQSWSAAGEPVEPCAAGGSTRGALVEPGPAGGATPGALALAPLRELSPGWLIREDDASEAHVWNDLDAVADEVPAEERAALLAAGAHAVMSVGFRGGTGPSGAVTLIKCAGGASWSEEEARAAEYVTADLARGLAHALLYEREQELVARLRELDNAKTDFMSTVSHELRTPLTSIAGYLEMLGDGDAGELNERQQRMLAVIERNTTRLRSLIEDLLVLSRVEAGTYSTERQDVEYEWLITTAVAAVEPAASAAGVTIDTEVSRALAGRADPGQIDRMLMNLLSNAVKFTPRGGRVRVRAFREDADAVIQIADTGMGVPEDEQQHLFTRFFRASNAAGHAVPGTGLGLTIVRTIVAKHGGQIAVESRQDVGTTVTVRLPLGGVAVPGGVAAPGANQR